ncbi:HAD family phosphatase [Spiractinospora alimapuensis]|nr:HAD family phosphatase [Spiractinospora alimapuensis]
MDGTLLDSEVLWAEAEKEVCADLGYVWGDADHHRNLGSHIEAVAAYIAERATRPVSAGHVATLLVDNLRGRLNNGAPPRPGATRLLAEVAASPVPAALVTSTYRHLIRPAFGPLGTHHFDTVVAGDEVDGRNKPHPEPYLRAVARLGVAPGHCVALEDSATGARSALAAGCVTVVVGTSLTVPEGVHTAASLEDLDLDRLHALIG